jgi:hypothetical protein
MDQQVTEAKRVGVPCNPPKSPYLPPDLPPAAVKSRRAEAPCPKTLRQADSKCGLRIGLRSPLLRVVERLYFDAQMANEKLAFVSRIAFCQSGKSCPQFTTAFTPGLTR